MHQPGQLRGCDNTHGGTIPARLSLHVSVWVEVALIWVKVLWVFGCNRGAWSQDRAYLSPALGPTSGFPPPGPTGPLSAR